MGEETQWTVNGRVVPADQQIVPASTALKNDPVEATTKRSRADVAAMAAGDDSAATAQPLDALLADRTQFTAEEDAEIQRSMMRHKVDREHPVIQVVVEMLLYRRQYRELLELFRSASREATDSFRSVPRDNVPQKRAASLIVQPTASATIYAFVIFLFAVTAWFAGQGFGEAQSDARLRAASPQVATLLTTRSGQAALDLVRDNGDALPSILSHCRLFVDHGRDAKSCSLWARGTGVPLTIVSPLDHALAIAASLPAWPLVIVLFVFGIIRFVWSTGRRSAAKAARGW